MRPDPNCAACSGTGFIRMPDAPGRVPVNLDCKCVAPVTTLHNPNAAPFKIEAELAERVHALLAEYAGRVSFVAALGVLELAKMELKESQG